MNILIECLLIGLITVICCDLVYKILDKKKTKIYKQNLLFSFILGFLLHYLIKDNNLTEIYCKKVCYGDKCITVCNFPS